MRKLKNPWHSFRKIPLILGVSFWALTAVFFMCRFIPDDSEILFVFSITFGISGTVCFILGMSFHLYVKHADAKLKRLKSEGFYCDAEIVQILLNKYIHLGRYAIVYTKCSYQNLEGKTCIVKSTSFLLDNPMFLLPQKNNFTEQRKYEKKFLNHVGNYAKEFLNATVYVNHNDPMDYSIEIFVNEDMPIR